jgi:drug/metabolite transporter (DMT)-like permease
MTSTDTTEAPAARLAQTRASRWISGKALLAVLFWGSSFVAIRIALEGLHPFALVATRLALGALLLYAVLGVRREDLLPAREDRASCAGLGLLLGGHLLLQSFAMRWTTAMRAGWLVAFVPVTIALGAQLCLGQKLRAVGWLGVAIASCGVLLLTSTAPSEFARAGTGDLMMLSSSISWAAYTLISLRPVERNGALRVTAFAMAIAVVPNAIAAGFAGFTSGPVTPRVIAALCFLGLFSSGLAFWAWNQALREIGPARSGAMLYVQPFVTLGAAFAILNEPPTSNLFIGGPVVLLGVWLLARFGKAPVRLLSDAQGDA